MNKTLRYFFIAALAVIAQSALAAEPVNYYNNALGKSNENLMSALRSIIYNHRQLGYNALWDAFKSTDTDADGYIIDMYSNCRYRPSEHGGNAKTVGDGYNREHSFPKSWFDDAAPMYTDLFHLYPTDIKVNSQRSNFPFGVCAKGDRLTNGSLYGKGKLGTSTYPGYSGTVFEPDDEYKGDFARTYFYMVTCYKNELPSWSGSPQLNYTANRYKAFSTWSINMLMEWTRLDPVSEKEIKRNDAVYQIQGNRNPFIDHPELAEYIWGTLQGQVWTGSGTPVTAAITSPEAGSVIDMGTTTVGTPIEVTITVKGEGLTRSVYLAMEDNEYFYVDKNSFTASEVNGGTSLTIGFTADDEGTFSDVITLTSDEATTTFTITATATDQGVTPPPPVVLSDSITEDWENCPSGGYWTKQVQGHAWLWDFTDAGIWGDNLKHGELSCRFGKTNASAISMAEDFIGGTSAIELWAGAYGSDPDATLRVDFSTDKGSSWTELDSFTVYKGILQQFILEIPLEGNARFRIVQTAGTRVNIDDITIYGRKQQEPIIPGDVNHDGEVNVADINAALDIIMNGSENPSGDVNGDGEINIADINAIIDIILGS
jgi:endonuclease I